MRRNTLLSVALATAAALCPLACNGPAPGDRAACTSHSHAPADPTQGDGNGSVHDCFCSATSVHRNAAARDDVPAPADAGVGSLTPQDGAAVAAFIRPHAWVSGEDPNPPPRQAPLRI